MMRAKYGAKRVKASDGGPDFGSVREARRYEELCTLEVAGIITDLRRQVPYRLADGIHIEREARRRPPIRYVADFVYRDETGREVVEDVKGLPTPVYRLKKHLMATVHGIHIREV